VVMTNLLSGTTDQDSRSWQANYIRTALTEGVLKVKFLKKDGTERDMKCTLQTDFLPVQESTGENRKASNEDSIAVWDVEKNAWRSFRFDSIIGFSESKV